MRLYLSGPMSGIAGFEKIFAANALRLRDAGHVVYNPAENSIVTAATDDDPNGYRAYLPKDIEAVCAAEAVALLDGWGASKGCAVEILVARTCNIPVLNAYTLKPLTVGEEAHAYVHGARRGTYGHPLTDYSRTAGLVNVRLADYLKKPLDAEACIAFMQMVKISRLAQTPGHRDSTVDLIGYTLCDELIRDERARLAKDEECTSLT